MTSAPVTDWPIRLLLVAVVVAVIAGVLLLMLRGWRARGRRQEYLSAPAPIATGETVSRPVAGIFIGTVIAGDWLDRVVVHELGVRSRVEVAMTTDALCLHREGAASFSIPVGDLVGARSDRGLAGKAFERGGMAVITWKLGQTLVESGIRTTHANDQEELIRLIENQRDPTSANDEAHHEDGHEDGPTQER